MATKVRGVVARVGHDVASFARERGELILIELQEEKARVISLAIRAVLVILFAIFFVTSLGALLVYALWWVNPWLALAAPAGVYLAALAGTYFWLRAGVKGELPFKDTLNQLKKDVAWLKKGH